MAASDTHRERHVIYNDDGGTQFDNPVNARLMTDEESYLDARLRRALNTDVDTYVWCVGGGA